MVRLKNIKKSNNLIECDIYPEDSKESGHIVVNMVSREIETNLLPEGYEWCKNHINHARNGLLDIANRNPFPEEYMVMWH